MEFGQTASLGADAAVLGRSPKPAPAELVHAAFDPPPIAKLHRACQPSRNDHVVGGVSKRAFDILAAGGALVLLSPALLAVWAAVRLESRGPGLFHQRRGGYQGRPFYILKFRTMRSCESRSIAQAKKGDDRTTPLGKILRKYSIDELPQLINVLMGDMSIVGPRPHALAHDRHFSTLDRRYAGRHRARPGITGLAQVSGARGPTDTEDKIFQRTTFDLGYVSGWSWKMDIGIILRTARVLAKDANAF
ncbi:MAG TPA: sugar transferase [Hyphomonadaceae bacterium]|nr:sugar transferase [Hyphomonadaceae bacterium]